MRDSAIFYDGIIFEDDYYYYEVHNIMKEDGVYFDSPCINVTVKDKEDKTVSFIDNDIYLCRILEEDDPRGIGDEDITDSMLRTLKVICKLLEEKNWINLEK